MTNKVTSRSLVPSPPSSGERARVRGQSGEPPPNVRTHSTLSRLRGERAKQEATEIRTETRSRRPPHPNPLPRKRGRGDRKNGSLA